MPKCRALAHLVNLHQFECRVCLIACMKNLHFQEEVSGVRSAVKVGDRAEDRRRRTC